VISEWHAGGRHARAVLSTQSGVHDLLLVNR
jgi:hypothetical protein